MLPLLPSLTTLVLSGISGSATTSLLLLLKQAPNLAKLELRASSNLHLSLPIDDAFLANGPGAHGLPHLTSLVVTSLHLDFPEENVERFHLDVSSIEHLLVSFSISTVDLINNQLTLAAVPCKARTLEYTSSVTQATVPAFVSNLRWLPCLVSLTLKGSTIRTDILVKALTVSAGKQKGDGDAICPLLETINFFVVRTVGQHARPRNGRLADEGRT